MPIVKENIIFFIQLIKILEVANFKFLTLSPLPSIILMLILVEGQNIVKITVQYSVKMPTTTRTEKKIV